MIRPPLWFLISLAATLAMALYSLSFRARSEIENRAVGLLIEATVIEDLASLSGKPISEIAVRLKGNGLTGVAITEQTVGELMDDGQLMARVGDSELSLTGPRSVLNRVYAAVSATAGSPTAVTVASDDQLTLTVDESWLRSLSLGIDPELATSVRESDLEIVARHSNSFGLTKDGITRILGSSAEAGARYFLPSGDQVLGNRTHVDFTVEELRRLGMMYVTPEFVKISGDAQIVRSMVDQTVRLHSIQQAEIDRMSPGAVYERYVKAFRERNIRWLLVRPMTLSADDSVAHLGSTLEALTKRLAREGGGVKAPRPFTDPAVPQWVILCLALVSVPVVAWVVLGILGTSRVGMIGVGIAVVLALATWLPGYRSYYSLVAALAFPLAGFLLLDWERPGIVFRFVAMSGLSLLGGLVVAGLLVGPASMIQASQFSGVKLAQFLPIFVVGWLLVKNTVDFRSIATRPILWGTAVLGIVAIVTLYFLMGRSGNDSPAAVSGIELKFRSLLDQLLYARPRTKEFLIGHPALVVGLGLVGMAISRPHLKPWAGVALGLAVVGQTGIVNTMCHLHSPLDLSLARIVLGLALGGIIGAVVWVVIRGTLVRREGNS